MTGIDHRVEEAARNRGSIASFHQCGSRLLPGLRLRGHLRGEIGVPAGILRRELLLFLHVVTESRVGLQGRRIGPDLRGGAAPRVLDQADGPLEHSAQVLPKVVVRGAELADRLRGANFPGVCARHRRRKIVARSQRQVPRHRAEAKLPVVRLRRCPGRVVRLGQRQFHVRLPGAEPDLADEHVVERDRVRPGDPQRSGRRSRRKRGKIHAPLAVRPSRRFRPFAAEGDDHLFLRIGPAPDRQRCVLLQDHVVAEDAGQPHVGASGERAGPQTGREAEAGEPTGMEQGHHLSRTTASRSPRARLIFSPAAAS